MQDSLRNVKKNIDINQFMGDRSSYRMSKVRSVNDQTTLEIEKLGELSWRRWDWQPACSEGKTWVPAKILDF